MPLAAYSGQLPMVKLLLDAGADVNSQDHEGVTALSYASNRGDLELENLLLNKGADANVRDNAGKTTLMWATSMGHLAPVPASPKKPLAKVAKIK